MADNMRKRTISYLRAEWSYGVTPSGTLEDIVRRSLKALPGIDEATRPFLDGKATIKDRADTQRGLYLHLVAWSDRQQASAVPHSDKPLLLVDAGEDWDFLTRNGMVMIYRDHCLLVPGFNMRVPSMKNYLIDIVDHARAQGALVQEEDSRFELLAIENRRRVEEIYGEGGVKRIDLDIGRYAHSDAASLKSVSKLSTVRDAIGSLFSASPHPVGVVLDTDLNMKLSVTTGRGGYSELKYQQLSSVARQVRDDGADGIMVFETVKGTRVKYGELVLRKSVEIEKVGNTVDHRHAWRAMYQYFRQLRSDEYLDNGQ